MRRDRLTRDVVLVVGSRWEDVISGRLVDFLRGIGLLVAGGVIDSGRGGTHVAIFSLGELQSPGGRHEALRVVDVHDRRHVGIFGGGERHVRNVRDGRGLGVMRRNQGGRRRVGRRTRGKLSVRRKVRERTRGGASSEVAATMGVLSCCSVRGKQTEMKTLHTPLESQSWAHGDFLLRGKKSSPEQCQTRPGQSP